MGEYLVDSMHFTLNNWCSTKSLLISHMNTSPHFNSQSQSRVWLMVICDQSISSTYPVYWVILILPPLLPVISVAPWEVVYLQGTDWNWLSLQEGGPVLVPKRTWKLFCIVILKHRWLISPMKGHVCAKGRIPRITTRLLGTTYGIAETSQVPRACPGLLEHFQFCFYLLQCGLTTLCKALAQCSYNCYINSK